jgi:sugar lactone lactonase YvrE
VVLREEAALGEAPAWDARRRQLVWVDIPAQLVHRFDPATGVDVVQDVGRAVGAALPSSDGSLLLATADGFWRLEDRSDPTLIAAVEADRPETRMNDAKCDSLGRAWGGTIALDLTPRAGSLYCLDGRDVTQVRSGFTVPNGLGWTPDANGMWLIDSFADGISLYGFDLATGHLGDRRGFIPIPREIGLADGMCVDAAGGVWVALFGGGALHRYTAEGQLDLRAVMPVTHPTSCAFGGDQLDVLYITTGRSNESGLLEPEQLVEQPYAGSVFACRPEVPGLPVGQYRAG